MKLRYFVLIAMLAVTAAVALSTQQGTVHEKLYVSLEHTDNVAVVDLATFKPIKRLQVFRGERGHSSLAFSTSKPSSVFVLHTPRSCRNRASNASNLRCTCASPSTRGTDTVRAAGSTFP
jgi:hypothetical protein